MSLPLLVVMPAYKPDARLPGRAEAMLSADFAGVVVVDGDYQFFIPVNVLDKRDGLVYISAIQQGVLYEGQTVRLF